MNLNPEYSRALGWNSQSSSSVLSLWGILPSVLRDYSKDQQLILGELPYKVSERTATWIEGNFFPSSRGQLLFCQMEDPIALQNNQPTNQGMLVGKAIIPTPSVSFSVGKVSIRITFAYVETSQVQSSPGKKETLNTNSEFLKEILGVPSHSWERAVCRAHEFSDSLSHINFKGTPAKTAATFFSSPHFLFGSLLLRPSSLSHSFQRLYRSSFF